MKKITKLLLVVMSVALIFSLVGVAGAEVPNIYTSVVYTGEAVYGYNEAFNIGYGESVSMQFDVYEATVNARWSFFVTENDVTTAPNGAHNYKAKSTNVLGFENTARSQDYFGGTSRGISYSATTFFTAGNSYKFVYTTATDASSLDGMMEIFICPTAKVGTASESWECYMYNRGFGDTSNATYDYHPTNNVRIGLWTDGGAINMKIGNVKVESSEGLSADETDMTAYGAITMENVRPIPVGEASTNPQMYIGNYEDELAHIFFGTTTNVDAEYGVILTTSENVSYLFEGKTVGSTGKYGIAIYNIPEGNYTARAYIGPGDNRTYGDQISFTAGKATYTVTYDLNGATGDLTSETVAQGTAATEPADDAVTLKGANFAYWADENGEEFDFSTILTGDITLTPVFESKYGGEVPKEYHPAAYTYIGVNENTAITYGDTATWQFDVLAYTSASQQIRITASTATAASGNAMAYKWTTGTQSQFMGFTAAGADDWVGGTYTKSKTPTNLFVAGYSYKLVYTAPSATYVADASSILYECATADVGTSAENWVEVMKTTPFGNTEGGNCFAPYETINMNIYFGGAGFEIAIANSTIKVNSATASDAELYVSNGMDWDYAPYVKYGTQKLVHFNSTGYWGYKGADDIGYGGQMTMQFDVISGSVTGRWAFTVTNASLDTDPRGYKDPYQGQVLGFNGSMESFGNGNQKTTRTASTTFVPGYTYKVVYIAATGEETADGSMILYECPTATVGTSAETWTAILENTGFDNSANASGYSPVENVNICLWSNTANGVDLVVDNVKVTSSTGTNTSNLLTNVNVSVTPLELAEPADDYNVAISTESAFGFLDAGIDVGYGETLTWTFKFDSYSAGGWLGFFVSEGDVKSNWETSMGEEYSVKSNRVVFTASSYNWLVGTHEGTANAKSFRAGYYYKLSYTAVSSAEASDGILRFYECEPGTFGTASEAWNLRGGVKNFGAANAPMTDVRIGMMERSGTTSAVITDSVITLPNGDTIKGGLCVSGNGTVSMQ